MKGHYVSGGKKNANVKTEIGCIHL